MVVAFDLARLQTSGDPVPTIERVPYLAGLAAAQFAVSDTGTLAYSPEGDLVLVLGSPGGPTIITSVLEVILHIVDYERPLSEAVDLPRFHHQWPPPPGADPISVETTEPYALPREALEALLGYGYTLDERDSPRRRMRSHERPGAPDGEKRSRRSATASTTPGMFQVFPHTKRTMGGRP